MIELKAHILFPPITNEYWSSNKSAQERKFPIFTPFKVSSIQIIQFPYVLNVQQSTGKINKCEEY